MRFLSLLLIPLACCSLVSCSGEKEDHEVVLGYTGRAKKNPYLAAERYLEADQHQVTSSTGVLSFNDDEGVVLSPVSSLRSIGDTERMLEWVGDGGHFVCFLERGEDYWRDVGDFADHSPDEWSEDDDDSNSGLDLLLESLEVKLTSEGALNYTELLDYDDSEQRVARGLELPNSEVVTVEVEEDNKSFKMQLGGSQRILAAGGTYYIDDWYEAGDSHRFLSRGYGAGRVTFISDARPFRNPYLKMQQHAEMLDHIASGGGKVVFSLGKVRSFLSMLGEYAWMPLYGLLMLTVLWLWKNLPRFGPLLDVSDGHARNYAQQVTNTGKFLWQHKCDDTLLQPLRDAVLHRSGHSSLLGVDSAAFIEKLSETSGIDSEVVSEAMTRTEVRDANSMVRISKTLQLLLKSL